MSSKEVSCAPAWFAKIRKAKQRRHTELLKPYGLSSIHAMYLIILFHSEEGMTLKELCDNLFVDKANTSRAVATLEALKYVEKVGNENNKLKYRICLTEEGKEIAKKVDDDMKEIHDLLVATLTDEEKATFRIIMRKVAKAVDDI